MGGGVHSDNEFAGVRQSRIFGNAGMNRGQGRRLVAEGLRMLVLIEDLRHLMILMRCRSCISRHGDSRYGCLGVSISA